MWQSLLFSQLIKNNLSNRCGIAQWRWLSRFSAKMTLAHAWAIISIRLLVLKKSRTPSCLPLRSFIPLMYQYLSAYDHRPPMYNNTCGVERPTEPPTTVPITTIEDVIGGRYHRHVEAEKITVYKRTKPSTRALIDWEACLHETM